MGGKPRVFTGKSVTLTILKRVLTDREVDEVRTLVLRCFRGNNRDGDFERCAELSSKSPEEYKVLGEQVRAAERNRMRSY